MFPFVQKKNIFLTKKEQCTVASLHFSMGNSHNCIQWVTKSQNWLTLNILYCWITTQCEWLSFLTRLSYLCLCLAFKKYIYTYVVHSTSLQSLFTMKHTQSIYQCNAVWQRTTLSKVSWFTSWWCTDQFVVKKNTLNLEKKTEINWATCVK